mgnify:FL=1
MAILILLANRHAYLAFEKRYIPHKTPLAVDFHLDIVTLAALCKRIVHRFEPCNVVGKIDIVHLLAYVEILIPFQRLLVARIIFDKLQIICNYDIFGLNETVYHGYIIQLFFKTAKRIAPNIAFRIYLGFSIKSASV